MQKTIEKENYLKAIFKMEEKLQKVSVTSLSKHFNVSKSTVSNMIKKLGNKSIFYPKGSSGFVDVRDVAQIIIRLNRMNITNERYIVNGHNLSFKKLLLILPHDEAKITKNIA